MEESITLVSSNVSKVKLTRHYFTFPFSYQNFDLPEIQSLHLGEIVTEKAKVAYQIIGSPVLVEDTSLTFHALGNLPGPLIKWFLKELGNEGLIELLKVYPDKSATASVCFGYFKGKGKVHLFKGSMTGRIAHTPKGKGFGWTPIFVPQGYDKTLGELPLSVQSSFAMRRIALEKLERFIQDHD